MTIPFFVGRRPWLLSLALLSILFGGPLADPRQAASALTWTYVKIADTDTPIPGGTGNFTFVGQPGLGDGVVAFRGEGPGGQVGIYTRAVAEAAPLVMRYDRTTPIPGTSGTPFNDFSKPSIGQGGSVAFYGEGTGRRGIYADVDGSLQVIADSATPMPGGTGNFDFFGNPWLAGGEIAFRALRFAGNAIEEGIFAWSEGTLRRVADLSTPVPGGTGHFIGFGGTNMLLGTPAIENGIVLFKGTGSDGENGIYKAAADGTITVVADLNTPIPGGGGTFTSFAGSVSAGNIDGDAVAFVGEGVGGQDGLYLHDGTSLSVVLDRQTSVPGSTAKFFHVGTQGFGFEDGQLSFLGDASSTPQAVYAIMGGVLRTVVVNGVVLDGKVAGSFGTYGKGIEGNMVAFNVGNYGGGVADYVAIASNDPPVAVNDTLTAREGGRGTRNVLANDSDPDGDVLQVTGVTHGISGTVSCTAAGTCTYTPKSPDFHGSDSFSYTASDGRGGSAVGTVAVNVTPVDDADVAVLALKGSTDPVGRLRTLTYTITVVNNGPELARNAVLTDVLPAGTTFASLALTQGTAKTPAVDSAGQVTVAFGSLPVGRKATATLTVNVLKSAASPLVHTAQVFNSTQDPNTTNNTRSLKTKVVDVGKFLLTPRHSRVEVGTHLTFAVRWTVPDGNWHELDEIHLRLRDKDGTVLWVRFEEATGSLALYKEPAGRFSPDRLPGTSAVISSSTAKLYLRGCSVEASTPTAPTVVLTLEMSFKKAAAGRRFVVELMATDDLGNAQDWTRAGTVTVKRHP